MFVKKVTDRNRLRIFMSKLLYVLIACTALLNIQCSGNGKEKTPLPELVHAESVMFDHPDSVSAFDTGTSKTNYKNFFRFPC